MERKAEASYRKKQRQSTIRSEELVSCMGSNTSTTSDYTDNNSSDENDKPEYESILALRNDAVPRNLSLPVDQIAVTAFMASYIPGSRFSYLPHVYTRGDSTTPLNISVDAVSLAMLARETQHLPTLKNAKKVYAQALSSVNAALRSPDTATHDSTLVSVLLLSLFESSASQEPGTSRNWSTHAHGALSLLKLRGESQFSTELGRHLFGQVCSILCIDAVQRDRKLPAPLLDLVRAAKAAHLDTPYTAMAELVDQMMHLVTMLGRGSQSTPTERLLAALLLDQKVMHYIRDLPPSFNYTEIPAPPQKGWEVFADTIHQYPDHHAARIWNSCRMLRLMLNAIAHGVLSSPASPPLPTGSFLSAPDFEANMADAVAGICASVPQLLNPAKYDGVGLKAGPRACIATVLWPLTVVARQGLAPRLVREYAAMCLEYAWAQFRMPGETRTELVMETEVYSGLQLFYVS